MAHLQLQGEGGLEVDGVLPTVAVAEGTLEVDRLAGREVYPEMDSLLSTVGVFEVDRLADRELYLDLDGLLPTAAVAEGRLETVDRLPAPSVVAIVGRGVYLRLDSLLVVVGGW